MRLTLRLGDEAPYQTLYLDDVPVRMRTEMTFIGSAGLFNSKHKAFLAVWNKKVEYDRAGVADSQKKTYEYFRDNPSEARKAGIEVGLDQQLLA